MQWRQPPCESLQPQSKKLTHGHLFTSVRKLGQLFLAQFVHKNTRNGVNFYEGKEYPKNIYVQFCKTQIMYNVMWLASIRHGNLYSMPAALFLLFQLYTQTSYALLMLNSLIACKARTQSSGNVVLINFVRHRAAAHHNTGLSRTLGCSITDN